jgi:hypothetical protein
MVAGSHTQLLSHWTAWNDMSGAPQVVTYSFAQDGPAGWAAFNPTQQAATRQALAAWDAASGLAFVQVPDQPGGAGIDLRFRLEAMAGVTVFGQASLPPDGDVALNIDLFRTDLLTPHPVRISHQLLLHEIGHALGLSHPLADTAEAKTNTIMVSTLGRAQVSNALLPWDSAAIVALYGTPQAEAALGLTWSWDAALGAVRGQGTTRGDVMNGTAHRDALFGGLGTDVLNGHAGDDRLVPGLGDDVIAGGAGRDLLVLHSHRAGLRLDPAGAVDSADGRDRFSGIEAIELLDGTLHLAASPGLAELVGLYAEVLGRAPDPGGLAFWWQDWQAAPDLARIAGRFMASTEYQAAPRGLSAEALAARAAQHDGAAAFAAGLWLPDQEALLTARLYELTLGRDPDAEGFAFWTVHLNAGVAPLVIAATILASPEASAHPQAWPDAAALVQAARASMWAHDTNGVTFI